MRIEIDASCRHIAPKKSFWRRLAGLQVRQNFGRGQPFFTRTATAPT
jgi:hypothetical protein